MSAALDTRATTTGLDDVWTIGAPRLLAGLNANAVVDLRTHLTLHGPKPGVELPRLLELLDGAGLTGRGGAGFPLAAKIRALRGQRPRVVVNAHESEPASFKDRTLLRRTPHLVIDGALAVGGAVRASEITIAVHDEIAYDSLRNALRDRLDARTVRLAKTDGRFVGGEARALVRGLDGGPAVPPGRRDHLTSSGVLVANAETFAQVAIVVRRGVRSFAQTGTRGEPGTALITVGGAVGRPGVVELPLGTPLGILLSAAQAAPPVAVVTGGYHGSWLVPHPDIVLSRAGIAAAGGSFGAGVLYVVDGSTCALGELARVTAWLAGESAKQCGPCRYGLPALAADVAALASGHRPALGAAFGHARAITGRGACSHPDGSVRFVSSGLHVLQDEVTAHLAGGCGRPVLGRLPVGIAGGAR
jgi:NADH:ubiquinone oxidoreductase subunit F (NADH-binding)